MTASPRVLSRGAYDTARGSGGPTAAAVARVPAETLTLAPVRLQVRAGVRVREFPAIIILLPPPLAHEHVMYTYRLVKRRRGGAITFSFARPENIRRVKHTVR